MPILARCAAPCYSAVMAIDDLYERDFTAWAEAQAEALRKRSANAIDWDNVAEEIESVGRSDTDSFHSLVEVVLLHFLKIEFSGQSEPILHWQGEIDAARDSLDRKTTPTLAARAPEDMAERYRRALKRLRLSYKRRGEDLPPVPDTCPYTWDDVLGRGEDWTPEPRAVP